LQKFFFKNPKSRTKVLWNNDCLVSLQQFILTYAKNFIAKFTANSQKFPKLMTALVFWWYENHY